MFRAGTYVEGTPWAISSSERSFGTSIASSVSALPPSARRSTETTRWVAAPRAVATRRAAIELDALALAVVDGERVRLEAVAARDGEAGGRVEPAREQDQGAGRRSRDPQVGGADLRILEQRLRVVLEHDAAGLEDVAAVRHGEGEVRVLLDEEDRDARPRG